MGKQKQKTLTEAQSIVIHEWLKGKTVKQIAHKFNMHVSSIYGHLNNVYKKSNSVDYHVIKRWVEDNDTDANKS